jgi:cardiolipin synthase
MHWVATHLATVLVTLLVIPFLARILRERRSPGSTLAWIVAVLAVPYVGIPLYLILGPRKWGRRQKPLSSAIGADVDRVEPAIARLLCSEGIGAPTEGNSVELLPTGEDAFARVGELIDGARCSISIATFVLGDDETGNTILSKLTERARAGVEIRLLLDGLFSLRASRHRLAELRRAGGRVATFAPLIHLPFRGYDNLRNHRKVAVFDGENAVIGGMNLAAEYMGPTPLPDRWCDLCVHVHGPAVAPLAEVFSTDWAFATGDAVEAPQVRALRKPGPCRVQIVPSGPDSATDSFYDALLSACYGAQRRIWVATPYFVPDDALTRALCAASRRGKDVRVMVPSVSNHRLADLAGGVSLREVERAGGRVVTYPRMLHAKALLIDHDLAVVGSANFDMRSLFLDYELSVFVYDEEAVTRLARWFEENERACGPLRPASALRALGEDIGRLVAPLV